MTERDIMPKPRTPEVVSLAPKLPPVQRSAEGVRDALFDELNMLRAGQVGTAHARAVALLARQIIEAARLELFHQQALKAIGGSVQLGKG
jgi:hypothetical protein